MSVCSAKGTVTGSDAWTDNGRLTEGGRLGGGAPEAVSGVEEKPQAHRPREPLLVLPPPTRARVASELRASGQQSTQRYSGRARGGNRETRRTRQRLVYTFAEACLTGRWDGRP
jgi:hypothetical protein